MDEECTLNKNTSGIVLRKERSRTPTVLVNNNSKVCLLTNRTGRREKRWLDQYYTIKFRYEKTQSAFFFAKKKVAQSVRIFVHKNVAQSELFFCI